MTEQRDLVLLSFPFSDFKSSKVRPGVIISNNFYNKKSADILVVPVTTNLNLKEYTILLTNANLESGNLIKDSKIKVDRVLSINKSLIRMKIGKVKKEILEKIKEELLKLFWIARHPIIMNIRKVRKITITLSEKEMNAIEDNFFCELNRE